MTRYKVPAKEAGLSDDYPVEYVVNPDGAVVSVNESHPAAALAADRREGWRLASDEEIRSHVARTGDWLPPELVPKADPPPLPRAKAAAQ
jgi:hypothetical protein